MIETINTTLWLIVMFLLIVNIVMRVRVLKARKRLAEAQAELDKINAIHERILKDMEEIE